MKIKKMKYTEIHVKQSALAYRCPE